MKLSLNWLRDYVDIPKKITPTQLAHDLTMCTVEVEEIIDQATQFEKMVVGKILQLKKHPNADKLSIAITDIGQENPVQIICGGTNLKENMLVAVALPGAKVRWHGEGDLLRLEEAKIRGEKSFGMICAAEEIGLSGIFDHKEKEIINLGQLEQGKDLRPGASLAQALELNDVIIDIDNKSLTNRPDLWGHLGMARELAVIYSLPFKEPDLELKNFKNQGKHLNIKIEDKDKCPRYTAALLSDIKINQSPLWLKKRLLAVGLRPINNVVDITNYVMLDVGEPTHAFDKNKFSQAEGSFSIKVRNAKPQEKITTLDAEERKLSKEDLVIDIQNKAEALAGIMGGSNTEINNNTTDLVLEAANFNPTIIRHTTQRLVHRTESSMRFEKDLDPNLTVVAIDKMLKLLKELVPSSNLIEKVDLNYVQNKKIKIQIEHTYLEKKIGQSFKPAQVQEILTKLGFGVNFNKNKNLYIAEVPSWRATGDVSIAEDIIEEVARIYGYDNLKEKQEKLDFEVAPYQAEYDLEAKLKKYLSLASGMHEVYNYPWFDINFAKEEKNQLDGLVQISNPPAEENKYLRPNLLVNLLSNIKDNARYYQDFKLFEIGQVFNSEPQKYSQDEYLYSQSKHLAGVVSDKDNQNIFLETKGIVEGFLHLASWESFKFKYELDAKYSNLKQKINKQKVFSIYYQNKPVGICAEFKQALKQRYFVYFELDFSALVEAYKIKQIYFKPINEFPLVKRDLAFELLTSVMWTDVSDKVLKKFQDKLLKEIEFLSDYPLENSKSLAFSTTYGADRTLTDEEVEEVEKQIIKFIEQEFKAKLRS